MSTGAAERSQEIAEERESRDERRGSVKMLAFEKGGVKAVLSRVVREYVRSEYTEPAIERLFQIGMGVVTFEVPTMQGNVIEVPAMAHVQVAALKEIVNVGMPRVVKHDDGRPIFNGVVILGEAGVAEGRRRAAAQRVEDHGQGTGGPAPPNQIGRGGYLPPPGHRIRVIEEDVSKPSSHSSSDAPTPEVSRRPTKAQQIAARRKATRK